MAAQADRDPEFDHNLLTFDYDERAPSEGGDYLPLMELSHWFLSAIDTARQEREVGRQAATIDGLSQALTRMRLNDEYLVAFRRLLSTADNVLLSAQEWRGKDRKRTSQDTKEGNYEG